MFFFFGDYSHPFGEWHSTQTLKKQKKQKIYIYIPPWYSFNQNMKSTKYGE